MCLIINKAIHKKRFGKYIPIKTKKDLIVYKGVKVDWNKEDIKSVWSPIFKFQYIFNNMYCTKLSLEYLPNTLVVVNEGFHSYMTMALVKNSMVCNVIEPCNGLAECVIPKGSKIFLSNFGEIVSNKIKIIGVEKL